jgi:hypothetical protein
MPLHPAELNAVRGPDFDLGVGGTNDERIHQDPSE